MSNVKKHFLNQKIKKIFREIPELKIMTNFKISNLKKEHLLFLCNLVG